MPGFGKNSNFNLATCHSDLQIILHEAIKHYDFSVTEGHRGKELQDKYFYANPRLTYIRWPRGKHNATPSMAAHVIPYPSTLGGKDIWTTGKTRFIHLAGYIQAIAEHLYGENKITHLIRWGGDWNNNRNLFDQIFFDLQHIELIAPEKYFSGNT